MYNTHVLRSYRLERMIFQELRDQVKTGLDEIEAEGITKLDSFSSLLQDCYISVYSLNPKRNDADTLTTNARYFNVPILDSVVNSDQYTALKSLCEGRELIAYEAVNEFAQHIVENLDALLDADTLKILNTLEQQQSELKAQIAEATENNSSADVEGAPTDECGAPSSGSDAFADGEGVPGGNTNSHSISDIITENAQKMGRLSRIIIRKMRQNENIIQSAVESAVNKAQETACTLNSWGNCVSSPFALQQNIELLRRVQSSDKLREVIKHLGKFREIYDKARKDSFIFGRGEKYDIVLGNDFTRAISSEYALLASPETIPLFIRKVQQKRLKQYRRRERVSKGHGDVIICIDESGSMSGDPIAWAKAVALVVLEHTMRNGRSCAIVRFASRNSIITHIYKKDKYTTEDIFAFVESFLDGGTDFESPLTGAIRLIESESFEKADIMFVTDGFCEISDKFAEDFRKTMQELKFTVTGVLMDSSGATEDFSLKPFCEKIYRLSEMTGDEVASSIISGLFI
jgi:uncharacterized protein with von Willebrand factor type A (vWA) domain